MITKVEVYTPSGNMLSLPFDDVASPFIVKDIDGLDPVKATLVSSPLALMDGTQYQNARRENRNIIMKLGYNPDYATTSVRELRNVLYGFFMTKAQVRLRFYVNDVAFAEAFGRVESTESVLFSKDPEVAISIICFDPDFISPLGVVVPGNTVADGTELAVPYLGSVEAGFLFTLNVNRALTEFIFYNTPAGGTAYQMEFGGSLVAGDVLRISTVPGSKYARLTRAGSQSSILYGISPTASWFPLFPGSNAIRVYAEGAPIPYTISYQPRYGGL